MERFTALWLNETKDGKKYMSGPLGNGKLLVFKNKHKKDDKHPDYIVYFTEGKKKDSGESNAPPEDVPPPEGEDIPF